MKPYKDINIGDTYQYEIGLNEWIVIDKIDDDKLILIKMIPSSPTYPENSNRPIWKKHTDKIFNRRVDFRRAVTRKEK